MTSQKQTEANRRNAERSTGPRTTTGKAAVRLNALRHGLLAQPPLLPDEDAAAFTEFTSRLRADLQPVGALEVLQVDFIVAAAWRLQRLLRIEVELFHQTPMEVIAADAKGVGPAFQLDSMHNNAFSKLSRYEAGIERAYYQALHELQRLQVARDTGSPTAPLAVDVNMSVTNDSTVR